MGEVREAVCCSAADAGTMSEQPVRSRPHPGLRGHRGYKEALVAGAVSHIQAGVHNHRLLNLSAPVCSSRPQVMILACLVGRR